MTKSLCSTFFNRVKISNKNFRMVEVLNSKIKERFNAELTIVTRTGNKNLEVKASKFIYVRGGI